MSNNNNTTGVGTMDILAAAFFVIAGAWLLVALLYSTLVLVFLRLRARGELGSIYEEDFGRLYLCGTRRYYIPLGCIFRRYIAHLQYDAGGSSSSERQRNVRFMTRNERRAAMETLLLGDKNNSSKRKQEKKTTKKKRNPLGRTKSAVTAQSESDAEQVQRDDASVEKDDDNNNNDEASSSQEPLCSICLGEFDDEENDPTFISKTCSHQFHSMCILDWLQRQANTECPCCRVAMVTEGDVWDAVKKQRKAKKREMRKRRDQQRQQEQPDVELGATENSEDTEGDAVIEEVTPPTSDDTAPAEHTAERLDV